MGVQVVRRDVHLVPRTILTFSLRDVARRLPSYLGEEGSKQPAFASGSPAAVKPIDSPKTLSEPVPYSDADDRAIEEYIRANVKTTWHCMATCPMKDKGQGGVVDHELNVYGVKGLKLAGELGVFFPIRSLLQTCPSVPRTSAATLPRSL